LSPSTQLTLSLGVPLAAGGRLWVFPALTAVVTTASGVAINVATDATASGLAWRAVAACTAAGAVLSALQLRRSGEPADPDRGRSGSISIRAKASCAQTDQVWKCS
jgi:hypothetical protein